MAGTPAAVGNDRRRFFHDRLPIRVGHVGHQYIARLNAVHFTDVLNDFHRARSDAVADSTPFRNDAPLRVQRVTLHHLPARANGLRTRLNDKQLAGVAVFRPLDVHWTAVVFFDLYSLLRQLLHFIVGQRENIALLLRHVFNTHLLAMLLRRCVDHTDLFRPHGTTYNRRATRGQRRLVHVELIRVHRALHHHFTQPPRGGDKHHLVEARFGINREHHAGRRQIGADHQLHACRKRNAPVVIALVNAV